MADGIDPDEPEVHAEREIPPVFRALSDVAVQAMFVREVARRDWGPAADVVWSHILADLDRALNELELSAPEMHAVIVGRVSQVMSGFEMWLEDYIERGGGEQPED